MSIMVSTGIADLMLKRRVLTLQYRTDSMPSLESAFERIASWMQRAAVTPAVASIDGLTGITAVANDAMSDESVVAVHRGPTAGHEFR